MFDYKLSYTREQKEQLKILWLELFEDEMRIKRLDNHRNDVNKTWYQNYLEQKETENKMFEKDEMELFNRFEKKINIALSFSQFIEPNDITNAIYGRI